MRVEEALAGGMAAEISINLAGNHIIPMRQKLVGAFDAEDGHECLIDPGIVALIAWGLLRGNV